MIYDALRRDKAARMRTADYDSSLPTTASNAKLCVISLIAAACDARTRLAHERGLALRYHLVLGAKSSVHLFPRE